MVDAGALVEEAGAGASAGFAGGDEGPVAGPATGVDGVGADRVVDCAKPY
jgi:hypothetical protein